MNYSGMNPGFPPPHPNIHRTMAARMMAPPNEEMGNMSIGDHHFNPHTSHGPHQSHQGHQGHHAAAAAANHHYNPHPAEAGDPRFNPHASESDHMYNPHAPDHMYMDTQHGQTYNELHSFLVDGGNLYGVSATYFDNQDLLWMGNQGGHVTSYYGADVQKYTSFQVHSQDEIRQILGISKGTLFLTKDFLRLSERRGVTCFNYTNPAMEDMQCMISTDPQTLLLGGHQTKAIELDLVKGVEKNIFDVKEPGCAIFRRNNKSLFVGDTGGKVTVYDPNTMRPEHTLEAHSGSLSDFDIQGHHLVTCGFSNRMNNLTVDRFLMVFDLRVMRATSPIQVIFDPMFLRFIPAFSNTLALVSQNGSFQLIDTTMTSQTGMVNQVNTQGGTITCFDMSETSEALSFGDSHGYLHLFSSSPHASFNSYHESPMFADPVEPMQPIPITDEMTPYSIIPTMYPQHGQLMSEWPPYFCKYVYRKPKDIDTEIMRSMKVYQNTGYAPNPGKERRNQMPYKINTDTKPSKRRNQSVPESPLGRGDDPLAIPKRYRKVEVKYSKLGLEDFDFRHYNKTNYAGLETHIPNAYCNSMLQTLFFIEPLRCTLLNHLCQRENCLSCELGFLFHMLDQQKGQTCQASNFLRAFRTIPEAAALGLLLGDVEETGVKVNYPRLILSWTRFLLQQVHSETAVRNKETTEEDQQSDKGANPPSSEEKSESDSSNTKSKKKKKKGKKKEEESSKEEVKEEGPSETPPTDLLKDGVKESAKDEFPPIRGDEESIIFKLFGMTLETTMKCRCDETSIRDNSMTCINLSYPECFTSGPVKDPIPVSFAEVLQFSLTSDTTMQAWCNTCNRFQPHAQTRMVKKLPEVFILNCSLENEREWEFWSTQIGILKARRDEDIEMGRVQATVATSNVPRCRYGNACTRKGCKFQHDFDQVQATIPDDDESFLPRWIPFGVRVQILKDGTLHIVNVRDDEEPMGDHYDLFATIGHVRDSSTPGGNLVAQVHVSEPYHQRKEHVTCTQWYLLNDFAITPIDKEEAAWFKLDWKVPCTIIFMKAGINSRSVIKVQNKFESEMLLNDAGLLNPKRRKVTFTPLTPENIPIAGTLVALDAEFVALKPEESELKSDGTKSMIKPTFMTIARITCIWGEGPLIEEPFLDDYVATQEQVVDYLTEYSGIKPGDLDAAMSSKHLTHLKSSYQKLRYLIDNKIKFIGHGLKKDFRVINIYVPKDQIIDTVELFHLPRQRMISLKFLAWYFLKKNIQAFTHDSIEDARTALQLYLKYEEFKTEGGMDKVRTVIKELYDYGRKTNWVIPDVKYNEENAEACL